MEEKRLKALRTEFKNAMQAAIKDQIRLLYEDIVLTIDELLILRGFDE